MIEQQDAARSHNYLFIVGEDRRMTYQVQNTNIASISLGTVPIPYGQKDLYYPSNKIETDVLTLNILISEDFKEWLDVYKWILNLKADNTLNYAKTCELFVLNSNDQPSISFVYYDCFPFQMDEVGFSATGESNVLSFNVSLRYNDFVVIANGQRITNEWFE